MPMAPQPSPSQTSSATWNKGRSCWTNLERSKPEACGVADQQRTIGLLCLQHVARMVAHEAPHQRTAIQSLQTGGRYIWQSPPTRIVHKERLPLIFRQFIRSTAPGRSMPRGRAMAADGRGGARGTTSLALLVRTPTGRCPGHSPIEQILLQILRRCHQNRFPSSRCTFRGSF